MAILGSVRFLLLSALLFGALCASGGEPEPRWAVLNHAAGQAIQAKDYVKLRATLEKLQPLLAGNPTFCTTWRQVALYSEIARRL